MGELTVQQPRRTRWAQGWEGGAGVEERVVAMAVRRVVGSSVSWGGLALGKGGRGEGGKGVGCEQGTWDGP